MKIDIKKVEEVLKDKSITAYKLSKETGISESIISRIRSGKRSFKNISVETLEKLQKWIDRTESKDDKVMTNKFTVAFRLLEEEFKEEFRKKVESGDFTQTESTGFQEMIWTTLAAGRDEINISLDELKHWVCPEEFFDEEEFNEKIQSYVKNLTELTLHLIDEYSGVHMSLMVFYYIEVHSGLFTAKLTDGFVDRAKEGEIIQGQRKTTWDIELLKDNEQGIQVFFSPYDAFKAALGKQQNRLDLFMGMDAFGEPILKNLATCSSLLIAGDSQSGKSVGINQMLAFLTLTNTPQDVQFILVTPDQKKYEPWQDSSFLYQSIVEDEAEMATVLEDLIKEAVTRRQVLLSSGFKSVDEYNSKQENHSKLPNLVVVIDELSTSMLREVGNTSPMTDLTTLITYSRAFGIHFILSSRSARVDVLSLTIRTNSGIKVCYKLSSSQESQIMLDSEGAERLRGRGECLIAENGKNTLEPCQTVYLSDLQLKAIASSCYNQNTGQAKEV